MTGTKHDQGKSRLELIEPDWLEDVGHVLAHGAAVHGDENWKNVEAKRYIAAAMRHILAIMRGEYLDSETQKPHAAHLSCDAMFLHYLGGQNAPNKRVCNHCESNKNDRESERIGFARVFRNDAQEVSGPGVLQAREPYAFPSRSKPHESA